MLSFIYCELGSRYFCMYMLYVAFPGQVFINVYSKKLYWIIFKLCYAASIFLSFEYIIIYLVLSEFRHSLLIDTHLDTFFMWTFAFLRMELASVCDENNVVSSAEQSTFTIRRAYARSLRHKINKRGPNMQPSRNPQITSKRCDEWLSYAIYCFLFAR